MPTEPEPETAADRLRAAVAGKPQNAVAQVKAADVIAVAAPHLADEVAAALHLGATIAVDGVRNPAAVVVWQQVSCLTRLLSLAG